MKKEIKINNLQEVFNAMKNFSGRLYYYPESYRLEFIHQPADYPPPLVGENGEVGIGWFTLGEFKSTTALLHEIKEVFREYWHEVWNEDIEVSAYWR